MKEFGITNLPTGTGKIVKKSFESLSDLDFVNINKYAESVGIFGGGHVGFYRKTNRLEFLVMISGNSLVDAQDKSYNTTGFENTNMYAIDGYGNLFVTDAIGLTKHVEYFNHSSFNAGKAVMSAGELTIVQGKLTRINNNSGHYKPTRANLHTAVKFFTEEGLDLSNANVEVKTDKGWDSYKARTFLANPNAKPPDGLNLDFYGKRIA